MNQLNNIKNFNPDNFNDSDTDNDYDNEYDTDTEISNSDLEYDILEKSEFNAKNCQTLVNQNNRFKNKVKKYINKHSLLVNKINNDKNKLIQENKYLKENIEILFQKNYKLIDINKKILKSYESKNYILYNLVSTFFTSAFLGICYYNWKKNC